jgi:hypothetical protein
MIEVIEKFLEEGRVLICLHVSIELEVPEMH